MIERFLAWVKQLLEPRPRPTATDGVTITPTPVEDDHERARVEAPMPVEEQSQEAEVVDVPTTREGPAAIVVPTATADAPPVLAVEDATMPEPPAPARDALVLRLESGGASGATFEVARSGATLGRAEENTIRLNDLSVSRKHARITYRQGGYWLSDLGSTSGTWVDGVRLNAAQRVTSGQIIDIGLCRLTVASTGEPSDQPATRSTSNAKARRRHSSPAT